MNKLLELREKRAKIWTDAKTFLDEHRNADGLLSDADSEIYNKMEADVVKLGLEIQRLETQARIDMEVDKPMNECCTVKEKGPDVAIKNSIQEARKILLDMNDSLYNLETILTGDHPNNDNAKEPSCLCEEAHIVTALAYTCLQRVSRIRDVLMG